MKGLFGAPRNLAAEIARRISNANFAMGPDSRQEGEDDKARPRLLSPDDTPGIENPVQCIEANTSMFWILGGTKNSSYPVYVKDSLLNTNYAFDYGPFRYDFRARDFVSLRIRKNGRSVCFQKLRCGTLGNWHRREKMFLFAASFSCAVLQSTKVALFPNFRPVQSLHALG